MSRFQANTTPVLDAQLEALAHELGLRSSQKADLLRELAELATWVIRQAAEGRTVLARNDDGVRELEHAAVERVRQRHAQVDAAFGRVELTSKEVAQLADVMARPFEPTPALVEALQRLSAPARTPPALTWPEG